MATREYVPVGIPVNETELDSGSAELALRADGFPAGLITALQDACAKYPYRFWICDNSGSMGAPDGSVMITYPGETPRFSTAPRSRELKQTIDLHLRLSDALGVRSDFHFLHPRGAMQYVTLEPSGGNEKHGLFGALVGSENRGNIDQVRAWVDRLIEPGNTTPLSVQVEKLVHMLRPMAAEMVKADERATVVIATDGIPNSPQNFLHQMKQLQQLPVWVIVRLCTSEDNIVEYWCNLDKSLEAPLEVLDDLQGEAREVSRCNSWLTYAPQLHTARMFGLRNLLFDRLDEAPLSPSQVKQFCELLLGCGPLPEPELDSAAFLQQLKVAVKAAGKVYDPLRRSMKPWVNMTRLRLKLLAWQYLGACGRCF